MPSTDARCAALQDRGTSMNPGHGLRVRSSAGFAFGGPVDDEWGRSESLDPDNVGDIADEGAGPPRVATGPRLRPARIRHNSTLISGQWLIEAATADSQRPATAAGRNGNEEHSSVGTLAVACGRHTSRPRPTRSDHSCHRISPAVPGREVSMITVEYAPGASTPAHTHHAQALVYVLEGSIVMQAKGKAPVTLTPGPDLV